MAPKSLSVVQIQIIRGAIAGNSYQEIAATGAESLSAGEYQQPEAQLPSKGLGKIDTQIEEYQIGYVRETAARLWQSLSLRLGHKVTKKSLAAVLLWCVKQPESTLAEVPTLRPNSNVRRCAVDWSTLNQHPGVESDVRFYGRTEELATLTDCCLYERCRLIFLIGMGGMGKTTLAWEIVHQLEGYFELTIWRSLLNLPPITELCADLIQCLSPQPSIDPPEIDRQIDLLIACLKRSRCLPILDNVESILQGGSQSGQYLPGYEGYDRLFRAMGELPHQSCAILTSREQPHTIARSQIVNPQLVRSMTIQGMTSAAAHQ